ncbi:hypothetical protein CO038_04520 [Candidatus Pacearchaeota archaeon CG_4_9_14_0_2_um_filter_39_13]|nr:nucleotidyltransferase family protein [Candidatus Pacearchaeota archaeon]OIO42577.1 MAG: hypothetical protein AUJ64_03790 [Candidatus Pacearchaeota archaeon CG1_02_39_14]PJC44333.1 MAG: hypothetical protein CO038_04520 [Candidatus Pacearchaeota archaeon CG_4_9_14_0_2_um_filter_39_13]
MIDKEEIGRIKSKILPILKEHNVKRAGIFGSYARGEQDKRSDIDLLVEVNDEWSLMELISLKMLIQKATKKKVDLVEYVCIRSEIKEGILKDEIPILR